MCGTSDLGYADMQCVVLTWAMLLQGGAARMRLTRTATSRPQVSNENEAQKRFTCTLTESSERPCLWPNPSPIQLQTRRFWHKACRGAGFSQLICARLVCFYSVCAIKVVFWRFGVA